MQEFNVGDRVYIPIDINRTYAGEGTVIKVNSLTVDIEMLSGNRAGEVGSSFLKDKIVLVKSAPPAPVKTLWAHRTHPNDHVIFTQTEDGIARICYDRPGLEMERSDATYGTAAKLDASPDWVRLVPEGRN